MVIDVVFDTMGQIDVDITSGGEGKPPRLDSLSVTPTESPQTFRPVAPVDGYSDVSVAAIPADYVGPAIVHDPAMTVNGPTVTAPVGYYSTAQSKTVQSGSATTPERTITADPWINVDGGGLITASESVTAYVTPTVQRGWVEQGTQGKITVSGTKTHQLDVATGQTIAPTESVQTAVTAGKFTTGEVKVGAIPSDYVGSQIERHDSDDLIVTGNLVNVPAGYYAENAGKAVAEGSATTPATTITANPSITVGSDGLITAAVSASTSVTPTIQTGYVVTGGGTAGTVSVSGSNTSQLSTQAATTVTPTTSEQTAVAAGKYTTGAVKVAAMPSGSVGNPNVVRNKDSSSLMATVTYPNFSAGYISNIPALGVPFYLQEETVTPSTSTQTVTPTDNARYLNKVTVNPIPPEYIVPSGTYTVSASGTADITNYATLSVPSGSAGSPALSVSEVTDHAVTVRASTIRTAGWIPGGTVQGASRIISASDLVSGTKSITQNGTGIDVTNYAAVDVSVSGGGDSVFVITLTYNSQSDMWEPDCTYSEAYAAYQGGKTIVAEPDDGYSMASILYDEDEDGFYYGVTSSYENYSPEYHWGLTNYGYIWTSEGIELDDDQIYYSTYGANAAPSDVASGKKFYNSSGLQVGTAVPSGQPNLQTKSKTYTPTTSQQTDTITADVGYDGLDEVNVTVNAMPSGSVTAPTTISGSQATLSTGTNTITLQKTLSVTPNVTTAGYVSAGTAGNALVSLNANVTTKAAATYYPSTTDQTIASGTYLTGAQTIKAVTYANLTADNIKNGVTVTIGDSADADRILSVTGTYSGGGGTVQYDTKTATASNYPTSLQFTGMQGQPKFFAVRLNTSVSSSGSTTYYYIVDMVSNGTTTHGNCFRIGSTRQVTSITSGYSWSYSGTTLTLTSSATSRSASPGAFYSGSYELMYAY